MPGTHQALGISGQIDHREKMRRQFPAPLFDREILLVVAHDRCQDFAWDRLVAGVKASQDGRGPLGG